MALFEKKLSSVLIKRGMLETEKATELIDRCTAEKKPLSEILIQEGLIEESSLIEAVAEEANLPPINLDNFNPDDNALSAISQEIAKENNIFPISKIDDIITLCVADPFDVVKLDDLRMLTQCELRLVVSNTYRIKIAIPSAYNRNEQAMEEIFEGMANPDVEITQAESEEDEEINLAELIGEDSKQSPVVRLVNLIIAQAIHDKISDIHIEPMENKLRVRYRMDGILHETLSPPKNMAGSISSRIKIMSGLDIAERRKPQDGKFRLKIEGRAVDFRVSILPIVYGEKIVLRVLDTSNLALNLDALGFEKKALSDLHFSLSQPFGMILVTGPTGSGKSTTLYSSIKEVMTDKDNVVTVEDPVEYELSGVNQVQVRPKRNLTFASALRSILRQDPDIIMIGEIRDSETVEIAVKAALTGHLVLSTLHTNDAAGAVNRMIDMGVDPFLIASSSLLISAQRLARRLCPLCKEDVKYPREHLLEIGFKPEEIEGAKFFRARGCGRCVEGYKGRFALLETLLIDDEMRKFIVEGATQVDIKRFAIERGMITLRRCGLLNAMRGNTSIEEALRVTIGD